MACNRYVDGITACEVERGSGRRRQGDSVDHIDLVFGDGGGPGPQAGRGMAVAVDDLGRSCRADPLSTVQGRSGETRHHAASPRPEETCFCPDGGGDVGIFGEVNTGIDRHEPRSDHVRCQPAGGDGLAGDERLPHGTHGVHGESVPITTDSSANVKIRRRASACPPAGFTLAAVRQRWPAEMGARGIWRQPRSRAYCSGCLAPAGPLGVRPAWHTTGARRAPPVPPFDRDGFSTRLRLRAGDTPERGDRCTRTGEQRRRRGATSKDEAPETAGRAGVRKKRGGTEDPHQAQGL